MEAALKWLCRFVSYYGMLNADPDTWQVPDCLAVKCRRLDCTEVIINICTLYSAARIGQRDTGSGMTELKNAGIAEGLIQARLARLTIEAHNFNEAG